LVVSGRRYGWLTYIGRLVVSGWHAKTRWPWTLYKGPSFSHF